MEIINKERKDFPLTKIALIVGTLFLPQTYAETVEDTKEETAKKIERVQVTGSRIKRVDLEGVTLIKSITADDMVKHGFNNVYEALANSTAANGSILGEAETGSYTPGAREVNLRGLGAEYTLVLINGKRLAYYPMPMGGQTSFVNLDMIPTAMVARIDIQTGGASAIYGSEAMGGVINIITKKGIQGNYLEFDGGVDTHGSNKRKSMSFVGGLQEGDFTLDYAVEYKSNDGLMSSDRPFHDSAWDNPNPNANYELNRSITVRTNDGPTVNAYSDAYCNTGAEKHQEAVLHYIGRSNTGWSCGWDEQGFKQMINKNETASVYLNSEYHLNNNHSIFANAFYIDQEKKGVRGSLFYDGTDFYDPDLPNKDGGFGGVVKDMWRKVLDTEYTDDGYGRTYEDKSYSFNFGIQGTIGDYDYSVGFARSNYDFHDQYIQPTVAGLASIRGEQLGTHMVGDDEFPVYRPNYAKWFGPLDEAGVMSMADWAIYNGESYNNTLTADITGDLFDLPAGPVAFSAYLEVMEEGTEAIPDERILNKTFSGITGVVTSGSRNRYAAASEFLIPVLENLDVEAAFRYDFYDDESNVGGALTYQIGTTYRPIENLVLRTAYGTTFRGPDMPALFKGFSGGYGGGSDRLIADACKTVDGGGTASGYDTEALATTCVNADLTSNPDIPGLEANFETVQTGDLTLGEETGETLTAGIVYEYSEFLSFNIDYYSINISDKIQNLGAGYIMSIDYDCNTGKFDSGSAKCQNMADRIDRYDANGKGIDRLGNAITGDPYAIHTVTGGYINAAERRDSGIDFGVKGTIELKNADIYYNLDITRTLTKREKLRPEDPLEDLIDSQDNMDFRTMGNASITWQNDSTAISLLANYKGELWNNAPYGERKKLPAWIRYNLTVGLQFDEDNRAVFGITNLLNAMPPQDETFGGGLFFRGGAYDSLGRQFNLKYTYAF